MSTFEIIDTKLVQGAEGSSPDQQSQTLEISFIRLDDGAHFTVSVKKSWGQIDDEDVTSALRSSLSLCLLALGVPMLEGTRMVPKADATTLN